MEKGSSIDDLHFETGAYVLIQSEENNTQVKGHLIKILERDSRQNKDW